MSQDSGRTTQYARAIVEALVERWETLLRKASKALGSDEKLLAQLEDDSTALDVRVGLLEKALNESFAPAEANFFKLLMQEGDLSLVGGVADALVAVVSGGEAGPVRAEVTSAAELSDEVKAKIREQLVAEYGNNLLFEFRVDPSLLGGFRIRVGDRLIDNSVVSRLNALKDSISLVVS
jgi:F-type H+-transporting ATPase subunit delta